MIYPINAAAQGWQCPICGRVYSPTTLFCLYCGNETITTTTTGTDFKSNIEEEKSKDDIH